VANIVSRCYAKVGSYNFDAIIADMRAKTQDVPIVGEGNENNLVHVNAKGFFNPVSAVLGAGIGIIRWFFSSIGDGMAAMQNSKNMDRKKSRDYMENRAEYLKMKLEGVSKDDPEYIRLGKIIAKYEDMINKEDRKIKEYEDSLK
jgi:hypothetical protein